jgi:alkylhydroperoxidase family enzyme
MRWTPPDGGSVVFEYAPEVNGPFQRFYGTLWGRGSMPLPVKELVRIRLSRTIGCDTCRNLRFRGALDAGLTEDSITLADDGFESTTLADRSKLALRWADAVAGDPATDAPVLADAVRAEFDATERAELTLTAAIATAFAKAMVAWGPQPLIPVTVIPTPEPDWVFVQPEGEPVRAT